MMHLQHFKNGGWVSKWRDSDPHGYSVGQYKRVKDGDILKALLDHLGLKPEYHEDVVEGGRIEKRIEFRSIKEPR